MGVPYLNIHYQLTQSDLSALKYTICLFLSYLFLCSCTWGSAILVVSGAHLPALVILQSAKDAFPSKLWFLGLKSTNLYNDSTLKCNTFAPFYTGVWVCVCVSAHLCTLVCMPHVLMDELELELSKGLDLICRAGNRLACFEESLRIWKLLEN